MARKTAPQASFDDQLVLFRYFLHELKIDSLGALSEKLNSAEYEGLNESGNTYFCDYIARISKMKGAAITPLTVSFWVVYLALCLTPVIMQWKEERTWNYLQSKI